MGEFDLDRRLWTIPALRSKNGREHRVPLSLTAIEVIQGIPKGSGAKLFPRAAVRPGASGFSKAMRRITGGVRATNGALSFTLQDLRRTVATGLQRLGVKLEVTESVLNHVSGSRDGVVGIYQRYQFEDEKRAALAAWAIELARIVDYRGGEDHLQMEQSECRNPSTKERPAGFSGPRDGGPGQWPKRPAKRRKGPSPKLDRP